MKYKLKATITEIGFEDLVDMFSTMLYGNNIFCAQYDSFFLSCLKDIDTCLEEKLARILLSGNTGEIIIIDTNAGDMGECYGTLRHYFDEEGMNYRVTLSDIKEGLERCLDSDDEYLREAALSFVNDDGQADLLDGMRVLQMILFGEEIYG